MREGADTNVAAYPAPSSTLENNNSSALSAQLPNRAPKIKTIREPIITFSGPSRSARSPAKSPKTAPNI